MGLSQAEILKKRNRNLERYYEIMADPIRAEEWRERSRENYVKAMLDPERKALKRKQGRENRYKSLYGITYAQKLGMYNEQNMLCKICGKFLATISLACVDHNHETGAVRALLCNGCNTGLCYIENKQFLTKANKYLKEYEIT